MNLFRVAKICDNTLSCLKEKQLLSIITVIHLLDLGVSTTSALNIFLVAQVLFTFSKITKLKAMRLTESIRNFPFTVVGDLETTTGYISEIEGGSMFMTS